MNSPLTAERDTFQYVLTKRSSRKHDTCRRSYRTGAVLLALVAAFGLQPAFANPEGDLHFQRAVDYALQDKIDAAEAEYQRAIELDPNSVDAHANYGVLLLDDRGDIDGAISQFVTALGIDPQSTFCQTHLDEAVALRNSELMPNINRGNNFYRSGQLVRAAAAYRIACYVDPRSADAHNSLAWTLYRTGDLKEALAEVKRALQLKPDDAEYINTLACVLYDQGDLEGAINHFEKAISISKKANPADLYGLAVGFLSRGDKERAIQNFKEALKNDPKFADARYLRDRIGMSVNTLAAHDTLLTLSGEKNGGDSPTK